MPTLLEIEHAVYRSLTKGDDADAARHIHADGIASEARLNVYRNTFIGTLTTALRLSFPAVYRLVGAAFFESAARIFVEAAPPDSAYLNEYGAEFPEFLSGFPPAASLAYLAGVARLDWAANRALHAPDADAIDIGQLTAIDTDDEDRLAFVPHPSVSVISAEHPIDEIWQAVLAQNDEAMTGIDLDSGPVSLLIERGENEVEVTRLSEQAWQFLSALCDGRTLGEAMTMMPDIDASTQLAHHLAAGRFVDVVYRGRHVEKASKWVTS